MAKKCRSWNKVHRSICHPRVKRDFVLKSDGKCRRREAKDGGICISLPGEGQDFFLGSVCHSLSFLFLFYFIFCLLGLHPQHREVPRVGVKSELPPLAYATAIAIPDLSQVCHLYHSSWQRQILNLLIEARDRTLILMDASQVRQPLSHHGNSAFTFYTFLSSVLYFWFLMSGHSCW